MYTSTDLADFGHCQLEELLELLQAWHSDGLPDDFVKDEIRPMINLHSGCVFLTNSEYQVAMINPDSGELESYYTTPYHGHEGFVNELLEMYEADGESWRADDVEYLVQLGILREMEVLS